MADYTITLNNRQEDDLADLVAAYNAPLLLQTPPGNTLTKRQYLNRIMIDPVLAQARADAITSNTAALTAALQKAADAGDKQVLGEVRTDLAGYI